MFKPRKLNNSLIFGGLRKKSLKTSKFGQNIRFLEIV